MKLSEIMDATFPALRTTSTIQEAAEYYKVYKLPFAPVIDSDDQPVGILTPLSLLSLPTNAGNIESAVSDDYVTMSTSREFFSLIQNVDFVPNRPLLAVHDDGTYAGILPYDVCVQAAVRAMHFYAGMLNNISDGIIAVDMNKNIVFSNIEWLRIHNIKGQNLLGKNVMEVFPETNLGDVIDNEEEIPYTNSRFFNYTQATVIASYRPICDANRNTLGSMAIVKDFSKINHLAIQLREQNTMNTLFSSIFGGLSEMVCTLDRNRVITYSNPAFADFSLSYAGDLLLHPEIRAMIDDTLSGNSDNSEHEVKIEGEDGTLSYIVMNSIPLNNPGNQLVGLLCIMRDVTALRMLQKKDSQSKELLDFYEKQLLDKNTQDQLVCTNEQFERVLSVALRVAKLNVTVMIEGENGVGKDRVAKLIHTNSPRAQSPFIPVNCGSIPESLWESEMFGYEEGSFTGAKKGGKRGILELADQGTLFLDEISSMPLAAQVKILRFLQNMEVSRVGTEKIRKVDVRIIAASNRNLDEMVRDGTFREDLYYRLNVIHLLIPPLRERRDEIPLLAQRFMDDFNKQYGKQVEISPEAVYVLQQQDWPGNVRQLKNVIEYSVVMCEDKLLPIHLPQHMFAEKMGGGTSDSLSQNPFDIPSSRRETEIAAICEALKKTGNNKTKAIKLLNISRKSFYKKYKEYNIADSVR